MKKNRKVQLIALVCICLTLLFTATQADHFFGKGKQSLSSQTDQKVSARESFDQYLSHLFSQEAVSSTINMHYTLRNPENYGITDYKVTYGDISEKSRRQSVAALENMQAVLKGIDKEALDTGRQMTYDILKSYVDDELEGTGLYLYQEILRPSTGTQTELPVLMAEYAFYDEKDLQDYLELLNQTPDYFRQIALFEEKKAAAGLFMADFAAEDIVAQCENFIADKENNYLLDTFEDKIEKMEGICPEQKAVYIEQNKAAVQNKVIPAYEKLIAVVKTLYGKGKNTQGLCYFEDGKKYYQHLVKSYTGSNMSVAEMAKLTEHQREADLAAAGKLIEANPDLITQSASYVFEQSDPEVILKELQDKMKKDFPAPPDTSFTIKYVHPSLEEFMAPAFYLTVPIDDITQNSIYINGSNHYQKLKLYTTLAHEGFPGHLYQNVMERSQDFHAIRSLLGTSGYAEGWATYVEMISFFYADIDSKLAKLLQKNQSAMLSLYATADMGIHYEGWSLDDTLDFFRKYQIEDKETVWNIYQLIVEEPAHYLKYYIGYLEFLNLRNYAKELYQEDYSSFKFHEALMKMGPAQFDILKKYLPQYYNKAE